MHAGQNSKRRQAICRIPALDEVLAQSLLIIQISENKSLVGLRTLAARLDPGKRRLQVNQAALQSSDDGLGAIAHIEPHQYCAYMTLHRCFGDAE